MEKQRLKTIYMKSINWVPVLLYLFSLGYALLFTYKNYYVLMNADTSAELILGNLLAQNGGILSKTWGYSTELRVLNTQLVYKLAFSLIHNDWKLVRLVSDFILLVLYSGCYLYMMNALGLRSHGKWTVWMLFLPYGPNYGYLVTYAGFYIPHVSITFLTIGLLADILRCEAKKKRVILLSVFITLSMVAGMGGARQALICYIPLVLASFICMLVSYYEKNSVDVRAFLLSCISLFSCFIGMLINSKILATTFRYMNQTSTYVWNDVSLVKFLDVFGNYLSLFGICLNEASFMGVYGAVNFLAIGIIALFIVCFVLMLRNKEILSASQYLYILFVIVAVAFCGLVFSSAGKGQYFLYHWTPLQPIVYPVLAITACALKDRIQQVLPLLFLYLIGTFFLVSHITLKNPIEPRIEFYTDGRCFTSAIAPLEAIKSSQGYAPHWMGSVLVEMTNGQKEIWVTSDNTLMNLDDTNNVESWLQDESHIKELPRGSFFVITYGKILDDPTYPAYTPLFYDESHMTYSDQYVTLYEFEDMEDYKNTVKSVEKYMIDGVNND